MKSVLPRQNLSVEPATQRFDMPRAPHIAHLPLDCDLRPRLLAALGRQLTQLRQNILRRSSIRIGYLSALPVRYRSTSRLAAVHAASPISHRSALAGGVSRPAMRSAPWVVCKRFTNFTHGVRLIFH